MKKRVNRRYLSCLKPGLAHVLGAASSDKNPGLLFYEKSRFLIEKTEFSSFSQSWGKREIFKGLRTGEDVTQGPF